MQLSTSLNVLFDPNISAERAVERLADAGFRRLDFNFVDWCQEGSPFVEAGWEKWITGVKNRADALGVRFTQCHGPIFNKFEDSDRNRRNTMLSHRSLEAAGMLGIPYVVFEPETLRGPFDNAHMAHLKQRNLDWFGALLPTAEKCNTGLALENVADYFARGRGISRWYGSAPNELIDLIDSFGSARVGACWDTGHAQIQRIEQPAALRSIGTRLKSIHVQDNSGESDEHLLPFRGKVDWRGILAALRDIPFEGDFTYEAHNSIRPLPDALRDSMLRHAVDVGNYILNGEFEAGR